MVTKFVILPQTKIVIFVAGANGSLGIAVNGNESCEFIGGANESLGIVVNGSECHDDLVAGATRSLGITVNGSESQYFFSLPLTEIKGLP